jgi:hypothetical protein
VIYVNTKNVLDAALSMAQDNSSTLRSRAIYWFNEVKRDVLNQPRQWWFLKKTASIAVSSNAITLPADFSQLVSIEIGDKFFTPDEALSEEEVFNNTDEDAVNPEPMGFSLSPAAITFCPGASGTAILTYTPEISASYADNEVTIFPIECEQLFIEGVRFKYFYFDKDSRMTAADIIYKGEMSALKTLDNKRKAMPKPNRHGYIRERI